jgi:DNA polymerase-1
VAADAVTPDMRRQGEGRQLWGRLWISAFGLARNLGIPNNEAARFIDAYFAQYPGVQARGWTTPWKLARSEGYVTTLLNRRRYVPEFKSSDVNTRRAAERVAMNTPVQGSAADIIKLAMVRLDARSRDTEARMLLQVHDELVVEAPEEIANRGHAEMIRDQMENALPLDVPLKVDVGIGEQLGGNTLTPRPGSRQSFAPAPGPLLRWR